MDLTAAYLAYHPRLRAYVRRLLPREDMAVVADLASDVWARALPHWDTWDGRPAWLYTIARNRVVDHVRHQQRGGSRVDLEVAAEVVAAAVNCPDDPGPAFAALLEDLDARSRAVLALSFGRDWPLLRVAAHLGLTYGVARKLQMRALWTLRRQLGVGDARAA